MNYEQFMQMAGFFLPPVITVLNKNVKSSRARFVLALAICTIVAFIAHANDFKYATPLDILQSVGIIFAESQVVFHLIYKDTIAEEKVAAISPEIKSTPASG